MPNRAERRAELQPVGGSPAPAPPDAAVEAINGKPVELFCGRAVRRVVVAHGGQPVVDTTEHGIFWICRCGARGDSFDQKVHDAVTRRGVAVPANCPRCGTRGMLIERRVTLCGDAEATGIIRQMMAGPAVNK